MTMFAYAPLFALLATSYIPHDRLTRQMPTSDIEQTSGTHSPSYDNTVRLLKEWVETQDNEQLTPLFAFGDSRSSDLLHACRNENDELASAALLTLQMVGSPDCQLCADSFSKKHDG